MRCFTIFRALFVRLMFGGHGLIAIWRLYMVIGKIWCWYLSAALLGLIVETIITLAVKRGKEWKWFCPSVFFYLLSVVPAIWFLELHEMEDRIHEKEKFNRTVVIHKNETDEELQLNIEGLGLEIRLPLSLTADLWLRVMEQFLLFMLIVGRWMLPKGALSHDQLSQLLLVYVGTAADIVEFYEAFNEEKVKYNRLLIYVLLGIWTLSILQFTLVLTATRARRDGMGIPSGTYPVVTQEEAPNCCNPEIYGIVVSIMMQDCPFLVVRLLLIFYYNVVSYTNMFFTSKNSLVILLLIYRVVVVQGESKNKHKVSNGGSLVRVRNNDSKELKTCTLNIHTVLSSSKSAPNVSVLKGVKAFRSFDSLPIHNSMKTPEGSGPLFIDKENAGSNCSSLKDEPMEKKRKSLEDSV